MKSSTINWMLMKVRDYLTAKEGCTVQDVSYHGDHGEKFVVQDVFGFRYEVQVTLIGRIQAGGISKTEELRYQLQSKSII